jgi:hypothetical protein
VISESWNEQGQYKGLLVGALSMAELKTVSHGPCEIRCGKGKSLHGAKKAG